MVRGNAVGALMLIRLYLILPVLSDRRFKRLSARFLALMSDIKTNWLGGSTMHYSFSPLGRYLALRMSIDEHPVWSVGCIYVGIVFFASVL